MTEHRVTEHPVTERPAEDYHRELAADLDRQARLIGRLFEEKVAAEARQADAEQNATIYAELLLERRAKGLYTTAGEWQALAAYADDCAARVAEAGELRSLLFAARTREVELEADARFVGGI